MKLEYDQCFYKYIEQKTKELFMSVNSVNGISQMQNAQGVSFGSSNQDDGSGLDIGKLLVGGVAVAVAAGVGIAGYKSGKTLKEGDGVLTTVWNGIKSWFGKNGDDVAQVAYKEVKEGEIVSMADAKQTVQNINAKVAKAKGKQNAIDTLGKTLNTENHKLDADDLSSFKSIVKKLGLNEDDITLDGENFKLKDNAKTKLQEWVNKNNPSDTPIPIDSNLNIDNLKSILSQKSSYYIGKANNYTYDVNVLIRMINNNKEATHFTSMEFRDFRKYIDREADINNMLHSKYSKEDLLKRFTTDKEKTLIRNLYSQYETDILMKKLNAL